MHCSGLGQSKCSSSPRDCDLMAWKHPACKSRLAYPQYLTFSPPRGSCSSSNQICRADLATRPGDRYIATFA